VDPLQLYLVRTSVHVLGGMGSRASEVEEVLTALSESDARARVCIPATGRWEAPLRAGAPGPDGLGALGRVRVGWHAVIAPCGYVIDCWTGGYAHTHGRDTPTRTGQPHTGHNRTWTCAPEIKKTGRP
jgi:hypothetical protein